MFLNQCNFVEHPTISTTKQARHRPSQPRNLRSTADDKLSTFRGGMLHKPSCRARRPLVEVCMRPGLCDQSSSKICDGDGLHSREAREEGDESPEKVARIQDISSRGLSTGLLARAKDVTGQGNRCAPMCRKADKLHNILEKNYLRACDRRFALAQRACVV